MSARSRLKLSAKDKSIASNKAEFTIPRLPREVLVNIFEFYVKSEGVVKLLTRLSKVSLDWSDAATDSRLWTHVNDQNLSLYKLLDLKKQLAFTKELNVSHLRKSLTSGNMLSILPFCPKLTSINFQTKDPLSPALVKKLPEFCPALEKVTVCSGDLIMRSVSPLLTLCGPNLCYLDLSKNFFSHFTRVMKEVARSCPLLEELHLQQISGASMVFPFDVFQIHCPKLRVLDLDEVEFRNSCKSGPGFPDLETFICRVTFTSGPDDNVLISILHSSTKLKTLSLPGNTGVTCIALSSLNCSLETLNLSRSKIANGGLYNIIAKWKHNLKHLDLSVIRHEEVLNETIYQFLNENYTCPLVELNLSASPILLHVLQQLLLTCQKLTFLNLESCRNLPMGTKRIYRTYEEVSDLREKLSELCFSHH